MSKIIKFSNFYFGPGSPKKRFLRFLRILFTKKWAGNLGITSEKSWEPATSPRGNGFSVLRISTKGRGSELLESRVSPTERRVGGLSACEDS